MTTDHKLTFAEYERRRMGYSSTQLAGICYMVRRSFGAPSFAQFWRYWNPLFGYYLYHFCYRPLAKRLNRAVGVPVTFAVSGAVHDAFASLAVAAPYVLFTPAFLTFGLLVVLEESLGFGMHGAPKPLRAAVHAGVIGATIGAGILVRNA